MEKLIITEENKDVYLKLYNTKKYDGIVETLGFGLGIIIFSLGSIPIINYLLSNPTSILNPEIFISCVLSYAACSSVLAGTIPVINYYTKLNKFKKQHPEINTKIKESELEKALVNYERLSKIPKDIEIKKEEQLNNFNDGFRKMTTQEKKKFLQNQLEFWDKVAKDETIVESLSEKENVKEKKIGRI